MPAINRTNSGYQLRIEMTESFAELFEQSQTQLAKLKNGAIITGYLGSWLLAGAYLAVGSCMSGSATSTYSARVAGSITISRWLADLRMTCLWT